MALRQPRDPTRVIDVTEPSQVGAVRRAALALSGSLGFGEEDAGRAALVAHEMASNAVRHGRGGQVLLRTSGTIDGPEVELLALDRGPGIAQLGESLRDGTSTGGTPGTGLGAITRVADEWDIWTAPGRGVALVARIRDRSRPVVDPAWCVGAVAVAMDESGISGDAWAVQPLGDLLRVVVADGLGHGPDANVAAAAAIRVVRAAPADVRPHEVVDLAWDALRATRGAAVTVVEIDPGAARLTASGVGNVSAVLVGTDGTRRNIVNMNGIVGHGPSRSRDYTLDWAPGATLVLCSDGITTRWTHEAYGGILGRDPALLAGLVWRDHARGRDDATVLVVRTAGPR